LEKSIVFRNGTAKKKKGMTGYIGMSTKEGQPICIVASGKFTVHG
jgi:hypothetical protein